MHHYDILIVGSGFAGSIIAHCLHQEGFTVCVVEKGKHPRFAIGESSTPVADMLLRKLADQYDIPWLRQLSRYGSWQEHHPEIICGIKRGFSYYKHKEGAEFTTDISHQNELLVAASINNYNSDTHWFRSDLDHYLIQKVQETGIDYFDSTTITQLEIDGKNVWHTVTLRDNKSQTLSARFIIDATGSSSFSETFFGTHSSSEKFETNTRAIYSHFTGVPRWLDFLNEQNFKTDDYPFNPDHSALHQIFSEGWLWMLRFNNDLLSAGITIDQSTEHHTIKRSPQEEWQSVVEKYPSLKNLFSGSQLASVPGNIISTGRLQRRLSNIFGEGWVALHHTAGFVDPLHSTGIAHSLYGVDKILNVITKSWSSQPEMKIELKKHEEHFFSELSLIDQLTSGCYKSRHHFDLFNAFTMLYFICTVHYEQQCIAGNFSQFLSADNKQLRILVDESYHNLLLLLQNGASRTEREKFISELRQKIQPFNSIGLMNPENVNMYRHSAVNI